MTSDFRRHWQVALATLLIWCSAGLLGSIVRAADEDPVQGERSRISGVQPTGSMPWSSRRRPRSATLAGKVARRAPRSSLCASSSSGANADRPAQERRHPSSARPVRGRGSAAPRAGEAANGASQEARATPPAPRAHASPISSRRSPARSSGFRRRWMRCTGARRRQVAQDAGAAMDGRVPSVDLAEEALAAAERGRRDAAGLRHGRQVRALERGRPPGSDPGDAAAFAAGDPVKVGEVHFNSGAPS